MEKKIKLLVLTDINVSNVHLMLATILSKYRQWEVSFLNVNSPSNYFDDSAWYGNGPNSIDISNTLQGNRIFRLIKTKSIIKKFDLVLCTGMVANLVRYSRKPYIYFCSGSDLDQYAQYGCSIFEYNSPDISWISKLKWICKKYLYSKAIKCADITIIVSYQYQLLKKLGYSRLGFFPHPLEDLFLETTLNVKQSISNELKATYDCKWIIFSATRHVWDSVLQNENDYKGNDIIIKTFNLLIKEMGLKKAKLLLINKGPDVSKSKILINEFGIDDHVIWLEPMNRKHLFKFYLGADICFDQFSKGCLALCAIESMACGTPTVSYIGSNNSSVPFYSEIPPVINCNDFRKIAQDILLILNNELLCKNIQEKSYNWVREYCSYHKINDSFIEMAQNIKSI